MIESDQDTLMCAAQGGAEHPEEPDDAEVETNSFSIAMLGMVEVESFGHGPEDSDVGWRAAVLGVDFFSDGCEAVAEQGVQLSGVRAHHSRIWAAQLDDRLAHRSERTRDCLSADSLVTASVLPVASGVDQDAAHAGFHVLDAGQGFGDTEAGDEFGPVSPDA